MGWTNVQMLSHVIPCNWANGTMRWTAKNAGLCAPFESGVACCQLMLLVLFPRDGGLQGGCSFHFLLGNIGSISLGMVDPPKHIEAFKMDQPHLWDPWVLPSATAWVVIQTLQVCNLLVATNKRIGENVCTFTCHWRAFATSCPKFHLFLGPQHFFQAYFEGHWATFEYNAEDMRGMFHHVHRASKS